RLRARGRLDADERLTDTGRAERETIEHATDRAMRPALAALDGDADELIGLLRPWGKAIREAGGYIGGPVDLWPNRD
ncbi:MAG TPA: hypothetical protein VN636_05830, partial [Acidimicrobiia bacterium]|nr:hypothetical protein [Acidimicrobiia bacterium]